MYAIAFDEVVADTEKHHPKGVTQTYTEIGAVLGEHGFWRVQGRWYVTDDENMGLHAEARKKPDGATFVRRDKDWSAPTNR